MSVYVDDMRARYGRMIMCHLVADTSDELHAMARRIGIARRWCQKPGTPEEHYDISLGKRDLAVKLGVVEITQRRAAEMRREKKRPTCSLGCGELALRPGEPCEDCQEELDYGPRIDEKEAGTFIAAQEEVVSALYEFAQQHEKTLVGEPLREGRLQDVITSTPIIGTVEAPELDRENEMRIDLENVGRALERIVTAYGFKVAEIQ